MKDKGVIHPCNQCDFNTSHMNNVLRHKGVKYPCDQCTFKATQFKSKHEGVIHPCVMSSTLAAVADSLEA